MIQYIIFIIINKGHKIHFLSFKGIYTCIASSSGARTDTQSASVTVVEALFYPFTKEKRYEGEDIELTCGVDKNCLQEETCFQTSWIKVLEIQNQVYVLTSENKLLG